MQRFGGYYYDSFSKYKWKQPNAKTYQKKPLKKYMIKGPKKGVIKKEKN